jgi:hypothetical protein
MVTENRETGSLIGSDKVEGTAVYGANDTKIGSIERVMIDKMSGRVSYAVLSFGGFLGIGDDHYPRAFFTRAGVSTTTSPSVRKRSKYPRADESIPRTV